MIMGRAQKRKKAKSAKANIQRKISEPGFHRRKREDYLEIAQVNPSSLGISQSDLKISKRQMKKMKLLQDKRKPKRPSQKPKKKKANHSGPETSEPPAENANRVEKDKPTQKSKQQRTQ